MGTEVAFPDALRFKGAAPEIVNSRFVHKLHLGQLSICDSAAAHAMLHPDFTPACNMQPAYSTLFACDVSTLLVNLRSMSLQCVDTQLLLLPTGCFCLSWFTVTRMLNVAGWLCLVLLQH